MEGFVHYSMGPGHCCDLLAYMNRQRQLGIENVCDVRFVMGEKTVYAHRSVLAVCSSYFEGMLSGAFRESQGEGGTNSQMMEIDLSGSMSTSEDLDVLLTAIYIGSVKLSKQNISGVTELACFLLVDCVREMCERFLMEQLTVECCLSSLRLAHHYDLLSLFRACRRLVQCRFHDHFIHQPDMLLTPPSCLQNLTKIFKYVRFHDLIQFLTRWVDHCGSVGGEGKEEYRLRVACDLVRGVAASDLQDSLPHLHQVRRDGLEGSAHVIEKLLSQVHGQPFLSQGESSSAFDSAESQEDPGKKATASSSAEVKTPRESEAEGRKDEDEEEKGITDSGNGSFPQGPSTPCDPAHSTGGDTDAGSSDSDHQSGSGSSGDPEGSVQGSQENRAVLAVTVTGMNSSPGEGFPTQTDLKRPSPFSSGQERKKKVKLETDPELSDVVVAFVPDTETLQYFTATECDRHWPRRCRLNFHLCVYHIRQRQWLYAGTTCFPDRFEEKDAWRMTCAQGEAYFISVNRRKLHVLDLKRMVWREVDCQCLFPPSSSAYRVRSLLPVAVDNTLYVLASDKQAQGAENDGLGMCLTKTYYSRLGADDQWTPTTCISHSHIGTPITLCNVSDKKVYVVKATIPLHLEKSILHVEAGHVFDSETKRAEYVYGMNYFTTPLRLLVGQGQMHVVDGNSRHSQLLKDQGQWKPVRDVDISDIKVGRATSAESHLPCVTHGSTVMGSSAWEFSTSPQHHSALTELRLSEEGEVFTVRHTPPPFYFLTITAACQLSSTFVAALDTCHYLHASIEN